MIRPRAAAAPEDPEPRVENDRELTELERVAAYRVDRLLELGFSWDQVFRMKVYRLPFEWHVAADLLAAGQTHEQVTFRLED